MYGYKFKENLFFLMERENENKEINGTYEQNKKNKKGS